MGRGAKGMIFFFMADDGSKKHLVAKSFLLVYIIIEYNVKRLY
jgi:hypothetical protein